MGHNVFKRLLKVTTPEGRRIYAHVFPNGSTRIIQVGYLDVVAKSEPPFAAQGVIRMTIPNDKYKETLVTLTRYLEDLYLKGFADEDIYTSLGAKPKRQRAKEQHIEKEIDVAKRRDTSGLHSSTRREIKTKGTRKGTGDTTLAESSDSSVS